MLKNTFFILFITSIYANDYPYPVKREASPRRNRNRNRNNHTKSLYHTRYDYL